MIAVDYNGDNLSDLVTTEANLDQLKLLLNSSGSFSDNGTISVGDIPVHLETIDFMLEGMKPIRYQNVQDKLYIDFDWVQDALEDQYVVIKAWRALNPVTWTEIYNQLWVKDYVTAKFKKQWGQNMTKFQNVQMPGGVTLNGEMIYNDAVEELKNLDEELRSTWETPPLDMIG